MKYNSDSLIFLEGFIERTKETIEKANWSGLINACGAFLGACNIENYGEIWNENKMKMSELVATIKIELILFRK